MLAVYPAFIDVQGPSCLRESINYYKPDLVKSPDILDTSWPHGGSHYDLVVSIEEIYNNYTDATRKILGFDKYGNISAKDNESMWRASEVVIDFDRSIASHLDRCNYENLTENSVTCILLSDDTDMFVLLLYRHAVQGADGPVLDTNATCPNFGQECLQLPGMLTLIHCDTTSYFMAKEMPLH